jgi:uncharacterized protein YbjT (DUF2867 family)
MKALVTGATGFTGSWTVPILLDRGFDVSCFVRETSDVSVLPIDQVQLAYGDLNDIASIKAALENMDVLVNIASIGFGHAPNIVKAALACDIERAVFISTTAIFTTLDASSKAVRMKAEAIIRDSGLAYTILRPTMIYGSSRDRNICRLMKYLKRWPLLPVFGSGEYLQQPVYVADVAGAIVDVIEEQKTIGKAYNISGGTVVTYNELIDTSAEMLGRNVMRLHLPSSPFIFALNLLEQLSVPVPLKGEQIQRLNENKNFSYEQASAGFGYQPCSLREGLTLEMREMGYLS